MNNDVHLHFTLYYHDVVVVMSCNFHSCLLYVSHARIDPVGSHAPHQKQYDRGKRFGASAKAKRRAFRCAARPSVQQGIGGGTLLPPMHRKLGIASKHSQILTLCQHNTTEKKRIGASAKARRRAFRRIARPSVRRQAKTFHFSSF